MVCLFQLSHHILVNNVISLTQSQHHLKLNKNVSIQHVIAAQSIAYCILVILTVSQTGQTIFIENLACEVFLNIIPFFVH